MEMLVKTLRGVQQIAYKGIDMMADGVVQTLADASGSESSHTGAEDDGVIRDSATKTYQKFEKEERSMADRDFRDDMLKLVRYKVLFVKREYEHVFYEKEELVHDNISEADYMGWKIAEFIQQLNKETTEIPEKWKGYPEDKDGRQYRRRIAEKNILIALPEEDKKYLRVFFEILDRYPREKFKYEEMQIDVLKEIRDKLGEKVNIERDIRDRLG
ncbi:MAG: hypothetical protein ACRERE_33325 [Candidatus Entotheonellia bacterium]